MVLGHISSNFISMALHLQSFLHAATRRNNYCTDVRYELTNKLPRNPDEFFRIFEQLPCGFHSLFRLNGGFINGKGEGRKEWIRGKGRS